MEPKTCGRIDLCKEASVGDGVTLREHLRTKHPQLFIGIEREAEYVESQRGMKKLFRGLRERALDEILRDIEKKKMTTPDYLIPYSDRLDALYIRADKIVRNLMENPTRTW